MKRVEDEIVKILDRFRGELNPNDRFFNIDLSEVLSEDEFQVSITISIEPKKMALENSEIIGAKQYISINTYDSGSYIVIGEDTEIEISAENIYSTLYWGEATKAI